MAKRSPFFSVLGRRSCSDAVAGMWNREIVVSSDAMGLMRISLVARIAMLRSVPLILIEGVRSTACPPCGKCQELTAASNHAPAPAGEFEHGRMLPARTVDAATGVNFWLLRDRHVYVNASPS